MCDCKTEIEAHLLENFIEKQPVATGHKAELMGFGLSMGSGTMQVAGCMPIELTAIYPLKKGGTKSKVTKHIMCFSHCPFCGIKEGTTP